MLIGLGIITWYPQLSVGLGNRIMGDDPMARSEDGEYDSEGEDDSGMPTMEEMMREAMAGEDSDDDDDDDDDDDSEGDGKEDAVDANDEASPDEGSDDENTE
jgi:hypothetical protein